MQCPCAFSPSFPPIYPVASHPMTFHPISFYPIPSHPSVCQVRTFSLAAHATSIEIIQPMSPGKYEEIIVSYETNQVEACIVAPPSTLSSYVNSIEFLPVSGFSRSLSHSFSSSYLPLSFTNPFCFASLPPASLPRSANQHPLSLVSLLHLHLLASFPTSPSHHMSMSAMI